MTREPVFAGDSAVCEIDLTVYPLAAAMKAAYMFLDRCYVFLSREGDGIEVRLKRKPDASGDIETIANEFINELLDQSVRWQLTTETKNLRELIVARALYGEALETSPLGPVTEGGADATEGDPQGIGRDWFGDKPKFDKES